MSKKAFITGVAGQDGGHLAKLLHGKGYEVYGMLRGQLEASHPRYSHIKEEMPRLLLSALVGWSRTCAGTGSSYSRLNRLPQTLFIQNRIHPNIYPIV